MSPDLRIVLDENLPWPVAGELVARGYDATSVHQMGFAGRLDPDLLCLLCDLGKVAGVVLVTYDNQMPSAHRTELDASGISLAVIESRHAPKGPALGQYHRDVIHRHAPRFVAQVGGIYWKYRRGGRSRIL